MVGRFAETLTENVCPCPCGVGPASASVLFVETFICRKRRLARKYNWTNFDWDRDEFDKHTDGISQMDRAGV
jgi:hypothetical protein